LDRARLHPPCARRTALALACCAGVVTPAPALAENPAEVLELPQVQVVGTTPLPGSGVPLSKLPANAQLFTSRDVRRQGPTTAADLLGDTAGGVTLNAAQGNAYQPDLNLRGFTASPVLGTPQGLSVFLDGVRINEPFGDSVNWDLIPPSAISNIQVVPGANPAFGLNTLGGAIAVYSKSGSSEYPDRPGGSLTVSGGSFGRRTLGLETGGKAGTWDWFVTGQGSGDRGWAEHNPSRVRQLFAKVGRQDDRTDLDLSLQLANNRLEGTQTLPASFPDIRAAYTWPDVTTHRVAAATLKGSIALTPRWLLSGNAYVRRYTNRSVSSNVNDNASGAGPEAVNEDATIRQLGRGTGVQLADSGTVFGYAHRFVVGASVDDGRARFERGTQSARFTADRGTVATGPVVPDTSADTTTRYAGLFASESISLDERWTLLLAGRWNTAQVRIADRSGAAPELDGTHRFNRFNPALGLTWSPDARLTAYASHTEGMRAPTAIELTCADPAAPCKLPNNFLADPPLKKVVSSTFEAGARGKLGGDAAAATWSAAIYRTDLRDDMQFTSSNGVAANAGYFQNVGRTRRQGLELGASQRLGTAAITLRYAFVDATYRTGFVGNSPANSTADANGGVVVQAGDRLPSIARRSLKLRLDLEATTAWSLGANVVAASSVYARGDENNRDAHGTVAGYAVMNLDTRWRIGAHLQLFARVDNVFGRRAANLGVLGQNVFNGPGQSYDPTHPQAEIFRGSIAPRGAWAGIQYPFE